MRGARYFILLATFASFVFAVARSELERVSDDELMNLIRTEKYVIVLFTAHDCDPCDKFENEMLGLREHLVDALGAWIVKAEDSQMTRLYSPTREPALVFFRHGVPLLYDGPLNDELILHTLNDNKEPSVKELTDENFEHLTQVSTGATTGDWFVLFFTNDCVDCQRLQARWEAVGARLKTRMNVARVNRGTTGAATARRFGVFHVPQFILFRQGKMYNYDIRNHDVQSFVSFAQDWYKNVKSERVPLPKSPFDDLVQMIVDYLKENPSMWVIALVTAGIGFVAAIVMRRSAPAPKKSKKTDKKEKSSGKEKSSDSTESKKKQK